jgi:hypothetical protein
MSSILPWPSLKPIRFWHSSASPHGVEFEQAIVAVIDDDANAKAAADRFGSTRMPSAGLRRAW